MDDEKQKKRRHKHTITKNPKRKQQQQQLKVVYISNPVRVNTSAAKFRALVQELTGQDADDLPAVPHGGGRESGICSRQKDDDVGTTSSSSEKSNLVFEDAYVPQLQQSFPAGILPIPSNMWPL
nr:sigma factor binding protein 1, chloroplastic [Ipomoea batatas]